MKSQKRTRFFSLGRKSFFTLALFVFVVASVVKIEAAGNVTGWLWGGGAGIPGDGTNTNVGWISMNNTNPEIVPPGTVPYGINIPTGDGPIAGINNYAWSENIGWISFNAGDLAGCPSGTCNARREGDYLKGWARIVGIKDAAATGNSGGWEGWISLDDKSGNGKYGVRISKMLGVGSGSHTYAWSASSSGAGELGWIDFGQAAVGEVCSLEFVPATTKTLNESSSNNEVVVQEVGTSCNCGTVNLTSSNTSAANVSPASIDFSSPTVQSANITLQTGSVSSTTTYSNIITANSTNCGTKQLTLIIQNIPVCNLSCPSQIIVNSGQTKNVQSEISVFGETGCSSSLIACNEQGPDANGNIDIQSDCHVTETENLRYGSSVLKATSGANSCTSPVNVKGPGWVETNPQ